MKAEILKLIEKIEWLYTFTSCQSTLDQLKPELEAVKKALRDDK